MIIPVKCFGCGMVLADKYRFFVNKVHQKKINNGMETQSVIYLTEKNNKKTPEGEVLDELGLTKMCCRTRMLTHVDIE